MAGGPLQGEARPGAAAAKKPNRPAKNRSARPRRRRRRFFSPLARGMLLVNLIGPAMLVIGLLYLEDYETRLIDSEIDILEAQATLIAQALGETASVEDTEPRHFNIAMDPELARRLVNRVATSEGPRIRLFLPDSTLLLDSRRVVGKGGLIHIEALPPPDQTSAGERAFNAVYNFIAPGWERFIRRRPLYRERGDQSAQDYWEASAAVAGETGGAVRRMSDGRLIVSAAAPAQRFKKVIGAVMLSRTGDRVTDAVRSVRFDILQVFALAVAITSVATLYLAGAIARPLRVLAQAADRVRGRTVLDQPIPDLSKRRDEIGDLSTALRDMTDAIRQRMAATERFAADVAHEIKNPLTSLKSAVETVARVDDDERRNRLLAVIQHDVQRLDRLISDISDASRLDSELAREHAEPVDLAHMIRIFIDIETASLDDGDETAPRLRLELTPGVAADGARALTEGVEVRLGQVFRNLLANARSFSPPGGRIDVSIARQDGLTPDDDVLLVVTVSDEGPGLPPGKEEAIFDRFYSERPAAEAFGSHSGLGLSISRQIVSAHGGTIRAENRLGPGGDVIGARFVVTLPALNGAVSA
jgi:two-component system, OmpR family, sensor histidine kinase ChvG